MIPATNTTVKLLAVGHVDANRKVVFDDIDDTVLSPQNKLDFQDYLDGQILFMRFQPIEMCENEHERRGWLDGLKYSADIDTDAYLAKRPVEAIEVAW